MLVVRGVGEDRLDVVGEAHLEHLVGLVEHEEAQLAEVERALLEVVHDAARRADDDVDAAAQRAQLHAVGLAAVDRQHVHALEVGGVPLERLADLQGELARRGEDQRLRLLLLEVEPAEDRQREGRRLARAGLGESDDVAPLEQGGDRRLLDGGGVLVADVAQRLEHLVVEAEVGERHALGLWRGGMCLALRGIGLGCFGLQAALAHPPDGSASERVSDTPDPPEGCLELRLGRAARR